MKSSVENTVWSDVKSFVDDLISECRMKRYAAENNGGDPVVRYSYKELREVTGYDFESGGEGRDALDAHREELAWDEHFFFDCIRARGLRFTTDKAIGAKWYADIAAKMVRAYLRRRRELFKAAYHHTGEENPHLREAMSALAEQAERDHAIFVRKAQEIRHIYRDLEREGDIPRIEGNGAGTDQDE